MSTFTELLAQSREGVGRLPEGLTFCQETVKDLDCLEKTKITSVNYNTFGENPHIKAVGA